MNTIDIAIIVFLLIGAYTGFKRGLLMEVISLASFFIAIILGVKLLDWGIEFLATYIEGYEAILPIIAFGVIFITIILVLNLLGKALKKILDMTLLGSFDDLAGALLGILKWALLISIFIWIYESFGGGVKEETTSTSLLFDPISALAPGLFNTLSGLFPFIIDFFEQSKELVNPQEIEV